MDEYARSHDALDAHTDVPDEPRDVARDVVETVKSMRDGKCADSGRRLSDPRPN